MYSLRPTPVTAVFVVAAIAMGSPVAAQPLVELGETREAAEDRKVANSTTGKSPLEVLRAHHLRQQGNLWITKTESQLHDRWDVSDKRARQIQELYQLLAFNRTQNRKRWEEIGQRQVRVASIGRRLQGAPLPNTVRQQLVDERDNHLQAIDKLKSVAVEPERLSQSPVVRQHLIHLNTWWQSQAVDLLRVERSLRQISNEYQGLRANQHVVQALESLGRLNRLGPSSSYKQIQQELPRLQGQVLSAQVPTYQQGKSWRMGVILNESTPLTLSYYDGPGPLMLTENMVDLAGIEISADAPKVRIQRGLQARRIAVDVVRVGTAKALKVSAVVLPPEGEDLGGRMGSQSIPGYALVLDAKNQQIQVRAHDTPITDGTKTIRGTRRRRSK